MWLTRGKAHHGGRPNYDGISAPLAKPITQVNCPPTTPPTPDKYCGKRAQHPTNDFMCHMHHQAALEVAAPKHSGMTKCMKEIE